MPVPIHMADGYRIARDETNGVARELLAHILCKIVETGDIVNIAIGGVKRVGTDAANESTFLNISVSR